MNKTNTYLYIIKNPHRYTLEEIEQKLTQCYIPFVYLSIFLNNESNLSIVFDHRLNSTRERELLSCLD